MTAEIAILNTSGLALAADSAVTVSTQQGRKSLHSANKLFGLSKHQPVAVMTYNNATLNGIPWETLLKVFRKELGDTAHDTLDTYSSRLVEFLEHNHHFTDELQTAFFLDLAQRIFRGIRAEVTQRIEASIAPDESLDEGEVVRGLRAVVEQQHDCLSSATAYPSAPNGLDQQLMATYGNTISKAVADVFGQLELPDDVSAQLRRLPALWFSSSNFGDNHTGVVVAGFGDTEIYPSYVEIVIEGVAGGQLKWAIRSQHGVSPLEPVVVRPFAQREMVDTFMEGVNPGYVRVLNRALRGAFDQYAQRVIDAIPDIDDSQRENAKSSAREANEEVIDSLSQELQKFRDKAYVQPIVETVGALAKDELAEMAESLVNLTSLKRRVSESLETVGGPIDVAVVTKGDGLVWIRRKHYFDPQLNPLFFATYFDR